MKIRKSKIETGVRCMGQIGDQEVKRKLTEGQTDGTDTEKKYKELLSRVVYTVLNHNSVI
jgi:hypothetical protein